MTTQHNVPTLSTNKWSNPYLDVGVTDGSSMLSQENASGLVDTLRSQVQQTVTCTPQHITQLELTICHHSTPLN